MNVIVVPNEGGYHYFRPDTTIERESKDFYCPEEVTSLSACVVLYIKISKAGKAVAKRFAERYYNTFGAGILLYAENLINSDIPATYSMASSIDYSTILSKELGGAEILTREKADSLWFGHGSGPAEKISIREEITDYINSEIETLSRNNSLRMGDIVAFELNPERFVIEKEEELTLHFGDQLLLDFKIC